MIRSIPKDIPQRDLRFPRKVQPIFRPARYKVLYGGRGSAKSHSIARALLIKAINGKIRWLCTREIQKSIQDSVHRVLSDQIERMGLERYFQVLQYTIRSITGSEFIFEGLHANVNKIKSMEGLDGAWVEEAEKVTKISWETLIPTLRKDGSEIWVSFNPDEETDDTYQRFIKNPPPGAVVIEMNHRDNPYFPEVLRQEMEWLKRTDYDAYLHVWEGQCRKSSAAQILRGKYREESFEPGVDWDGPYYGGDFGFAADPSTLVMCWVHDARLYIEHEVYGFGVETDDLPKFYEPVPGAAAHVSRFDSARPETISYLKRHGHPRAVGVEKWPGSVEDGINYLRGEFVEIIIHPRCKHTLEEARLWCYKVDKNSGDVLPEVEDKNNHCWDAVRYAIAPLIRGEVKFNKTQFRPLPADVEKWLTVKMLTVALDDVRDDAAALGASIQMWGVEGLRAMHLLSESRLYDIFPQLVDAIEIAWKESRGLKPSELWLDGGSVGQTLIRELRRRGLPAREWAPAGKNNQKDIKVLDVAWRAKQASVHVAAGRVFVYEGAGVVGEGGGLSTDAMSLALLVWQSRGGGREELRAA